MEKEENLITLSPLTVYCVITYITISNLIHQFNIYAAIPKPVMLP